jgi:hypothetical protein
MGMHFRSNGESDPEVMRLLYLFDDCIDFSELTSDGWTLVEATEFDLDNRRAQHQVIHGVLSFLLRKFRTETTDYVNVGALRYGLAFAIERSDIESVRSILDFDSKVVNYVDRICEEPVMHVVTIPGDFNIEILRLLVNKGANPHAIFCGETPTSVALRFSRVFFQWRNYLKILYQELDDFILREASVGYPLSQAEWRSDTLRDLFSLESTERFRDLFYPYSSDHGKCDRCFGVGELFYGYTGMVEPWWEELKHQVKTEQCICSMLDGLFVEPREAKEGSMIGAGECTGQESKIDPRVCSFCRLPVCRVLSRNKPCQDSKHNEAISADLVDRNDAQHEPDPYPFLRGNRNLWKLSLKHFYRQQGRWRKEYEPGKYYCYECLARLEGWLEEDYDDSDEDSGSEQMVYSMPGAYID